MSALPQERCDEFLRQCSQVLRTAIDPSKVDFNLGGYDRDDRDRWCGELVFSDQGIPKVVAEIQFVGSISTKSDPWL